MVKRILMIGLLVALAVPALAQWTYIDTLDAITVSGTAGNVFTDAQIRAGNAHPQATLATCSLTTATIRVTTDGSTPTTSYGEVIAPGNYAWQGTDVLLNLQAIRDDSTSAELNCTLYGGGGR